LGKGYGQVTGPAKAFYTPVDATLYTSYITKMKKMARGSAIHDTFCQNVRARRAELGLKQKQVAKMLGVSQPSYAAIETGRCVPTINVVAKVAKSLYTTPSALLSSPVAA
jgi:DNA-binding XRE family transcriptional regulator